VPNKRFALSDTCADGDAGGFEKKENPSFEEYDYHQTMGHQDDHGRCLSIFANTNTDVSDSDDEDANTSIEDEQPCLEPNTGHDETQSDTKGSFPSKKDSSTRSKQQSNEKSTREIRIKPVPKVLNPSEFFEGAFNMLQRSKFNSVSIHPVIPSRYDVLNEEEETAEQIRERINVLANKLVQLKKTKRQ
jgi:hypothetical protein